MSRKCNRSFVRLRLCGLMGLGWFMLGGCGKVSLGSLPDEGGGGAAGPRAQSGGGGEPAARRTVATAGEAGAAPAGGQAGSSGAGSGAGVGGQGGEVGSAGRGDHGGSAGATTIPAFCGVGGAQSGPLLGDVNWDGVVNSADGLLVDQHINGHAPTPPFYLEVADVDCSGAVNMIDLGYIAEYSVQNITEFPCPLCP